MARKQPAAPRGTMGGRLLRARLVSIAVKVTVGGLVCGLVMCVPVGAAQAVTAQHAQPVTVTK